MSCLGHSIKNTLSKASNRNIKIRKSELDEVLYILPIHNRYDKKTGTSYVYKTNDWGHCVLLVSRQPTFKFGNPLKYLYKVLLTKKLENIQLKLRPGHIFYVQVTNA